METERPPQWLFDCPQRPEKEAKKEAREKGEWGEAKLDTEVAQLRLAERDNGPPKVYPFKLEMIGPDYTMGFFGKRREGKSFAMRWILYHLRTQIPRIYVFTTTKLNYFWQDFVPSDKIFNNFSPGVMNQIRLNQIELVEWMKKNPAEGKKINPYVVIVLEDCLSQDLQHMELLKDIFFNGRHLKLMLLISLQYARGIPPGFRENCDLAFLYRMHSLPQIEAVCENFLGHYDKKTARNILEECVWKDQETQARQFLAVDMSGNSDIDHMLYVGQASEPPKFRFGCEEWWANQNN